MRGGDLLEDEHVLAVLLEADRVRLHVSQDPVEVALVHAQKLAVVLSQHDRRRPAGGGGARVKCERRLDAIRDRVGSWFG